MTTLFFSLLIGQKQLIEKKEERGKEYHVSMREKVVIKWLYKYHFSSHNHFHGFSSQTCTQQHS